MAVVPVILHSAAYIASGDPAYELGKRAAYRLLLNISDPQQVTTDAAKGAAVNLTGVSAVSWDRVNAKGGTVVPMAAPPTGLTVSVGPVTPDNVNTGLRYLAVNLTPPGAAHATRFVGWATLGTVWTGAPTTPAGIPPNYASAGTGLAVLIYNNTSCSGAPIAQNVSRPFWSNVSNGDVSGFGGDLSVSCRGSLKLPSTGTYRFVLQSDEGCRLWLDGVPFIDDWNTNYGDRSSGLFNGTAGQIVNVRAEMFNSSNATTFQMNWSIAGALVVPIPVTAMYPIAWDTPIVEAVRPVQAGFDANYVKRYF